MSVKYLVVPGYVSSINDGDLHYISAARLAQLYGLKPGEWARYNPLQDKHSELLRLRPRRNGNYELPSEST